jgi:hypothetical protein
MTSPVYWSPTLYSLAMRLLYGRYYSARYTAVADLIPGNKSVHEACAGDCRLYRHFLIDRPIVYSASDINAVFVEAGKAKGINIKRLDVRTGIIPDADYVLMLASLYQFIPEHTAIVDRLLSSARERCIITEPVRNLATSDNPILRVIGRLGVNPGTGSAPHRFNEKSLDAFMFGTYAGRIERAELIAGGREKMFVLKRS